MPQQPARLDCVCLNGQGETVITGEAEVLAPMEKVRRPRVLLPEAHLHERGLHWARLIEAARRFAPAKTAVVHPCGRSLPRRNARRARAGLIVPVLVGPRPKIESAAQAAGVDLNGIEIVEAPHSHARGEGGLLARAGPGGGLDEGGAHTDEILVAAMSRATACEPSGA